MYTRDEESASTQICRATDPLSFPSALPKLLHMLERTYVSTHRNKKAASIKVRQFNLKHADLHPTLSKFLLGLITQQDL